MHTISDLKKKMQNNGHQILGGETLGSIAVHKNKTSGACWCYCTSCQSLGLLKPDGSLAGKATKEFCRGSAKVPLTAHSH